MKKLLPSLLLLFCSFLSHAQWLERNNGLVGGHVRCFATLGTTLFAGTDGGGVFKSTDNGATWSASSNGITFPFITTLAVVGNDLFAGTLFGVFRSSDNGLNWTEPNKEFATGISRMVAVSDYLFVHTSGADGPFQDQTFRSADRGLTWTEVQNFTYRISFAAMGGDLYIASYYNGDKWIFRSSNNGDSWVRATGAGLPEGLSAGEVTDVISKGSLLFLILFDYNDNRSSRVYKSTDRGENWTLASTGLPQDEYNAIAVKEDNLFLAGNAGVYRSSNNGASWVVANTGLTNARVYTFGIAGSTLLAGTNTGVFTSATNGSSWTLSNIGLAAVTIAAIVQKGTDLFVGGQGVFTSSNKGETWSERNTGLTNKTVNALIAVGNDLFAGVEEDGVFYSANNGVNWIGINNGLNNKRITSLLSYGEKIFAGTPGDGIYVSTNKGQNWQKLDEFKVSLGGNSFREYDYAIALEQINENLFAGLDDAVFRSTDGGVTWNKTGLEKTIYSFKTIGNKIFAAGRGGVFVSTDSGVTWNPASGKLPKILPNEIPVLSLAVIGTGLFATTYGGVFVSTDLGNSWKAINEGAPTNTITNALVVTETSLLASFYGRGVWERPLAELAPPATPVAAAASGINSTGFTANWAAASGATSYQLDISKDNFVTFVDGYNAKTVTGTSQAVTGLTSTTTYQYRVRAVNELGISGNSASISATTLIPPPTAPTALAATAISPTGFTANWAAVSSATGYQLDISKDNFATFVEGYDSKPVGGTSQTVTGLTSATPYQYRVRAVNDGGVSGNSANISVTTSIPPPSTPTSLAATAISSTGFTANWAAVSSASGYQLDISKDNFATFVEGYNSKPITGTSQAVTGLTSATPYQYRVRAVNDGGVSGNSANISVTTSIPPPSTPTSLAATAISSTGFTANWAAASGATGYQLDISKDNFATFVDGYNSKPVGGTSQTVTGLVPVTVYQYRVRAVNEVGVSGNSSSVSVTTGVVITGDLNTAATTTAVYPNPFADYIEIENKPGQITEILLYDVTGRRRVLPFEDRGEVLRVPTNTIPAGVYLLYIQEGTSVKTAKMMKR